MKPHAPPLLNDSAHYDSLVAAKRGRIRASLTNIRDQVFVACNAYLVEAPTDFQTLLPIALGSHRRRALKHLYSGHSSKNTVWRKEVTEAMRLSGPFCAYCNLDSFQEFDHFLPITQFPEFSIFSKNLVPACGRCNKKKQDFVGHNNYLHPYYAVLIPPAGTAIRCIVSQQNGLVIAEYVIVMPNPMTNTADKFRRQCESTALTARYSDSAHDRLTEYKLGFFGKSVHDRLNDLGAERPQYVGHGPFYWRTLLIDALVADQAILMAL